MKIKVYLWFFVTVILCSFPILKEKEIFLTFDDGPISPYTTEIAKMLEKEGAKGTFFLVGKKVTIHGDIVKELNKRGHTIGNHTFNHNRFSEESLEESLEDLLKAEVVLAEKIGYFTRIYRPPGGRIPKSKERIFEDLGFKAVFWDVNTRDFEGRSSFYIIFKTLLISWDRSIILMHSCPSAIKSLPTLLKLLKLFNFKIKPLPIEELSSTAPNHQIIKINDRQKFLLQLIGMTDFVRSDTFLLEKALLSLRDYKDFLTSLSNIRAIKRKSQDPEEEEFWEREKARLEVYIRQSIIRRKLLENLIANIILLPKEAY
ncbi:MAG: polysaccharide deacetylase family protein [Synergistetes bacterium]|nr:polysaccharide deacetylase family protein [Synergistota bacterium]MCX8127917.1 polysaccharide deacetylase family protein [Synergistota bacterium]MDW8192179.1 polysaccharide deacetylase family protein [Synergistota bacterium]